MSEWTEYDELAKMGDALKELREENQRRQSQMRLEHGLISLLNT
jgi:hypothetical protein